MGKLVIALEYCMLQKDNQVALLKGISWFSSKNYDNTLFIKIRSRHDTKFKTYSFRVIYKSNELQI